MKSLKMLPLLFGAARMRTLSLGGLMVPAALLGVSLAATSLTACADENDPATWVKRLDDPAQRTPAIKRLGEFYGDALNNAPDKKNAKEDPKVKAVLDVVVEPLAKQYLAGNLDEKTRKELIKALGDMADPRASQAFAKALTDYEPGKNDDDVKFSAQATTNMAKAGKLTDQGLIDALWTCFSKFQISKAKSINLVQDLTNAIIAAKHPSWGPKAVEKVSQPFNPAPDDKFANDQFEFTQGTSIRVIGLLKFAGGVKPLVTALLTPSKASMRNAIRNALLKMPKEAEGALIGALKGTDADTNALYKNYPNGAGIVMLSEPLAYLSRPATRDALLETVNATDDDTIQTIVALNLVHFPKDPNVQKAFLATYNKVDPQTSVQLGGGFGRAVMLSAASHFYDPAMTDFFLKEVAAAKGTSADAVQAAGLLSAIRVMPASKKQDVNDAIEKTLGKGPATEKDLFKGAAGVLDKCKEDANCYASFLDQPIPSAADGRFAFTKACYMAATYGNDATRGVLVSKIDKVKDPGVRLAMAEAIEFLGPKGDVSAADAFDKIVDADAASGNASLKMADDALAKVSLILRSRATP